jgi:hypothetical protein
VLGSTTWIYDPQGASSGNGSLLLEQSTKAGGRTVCPEQQVGPAVSRSSGGLRLRITASCSAALGVGLGSGQHVRGLGPVFFAALLSAALRAYT